MFTLLSDAVPHVSKAMKSACHVECRHLASSWSHKTEVRSDSGLKGQMFVPGGVMQSDKAENSSDSNGVVD